LREGKVISESDTFGKIGISSKKDKKENEAGDKIIGRQMMPPEELTREEQREIGERLWGDPYIVSQGDEPVPFTYQMHFRGFWSKEERRKLYDELKKAVKSNDKSFLQAIEDLYGNAEWKRLNVELAKSEKFEDMSPDLFHGFWMPEQRKALEEGLKSAIKSNDENKIAELWDEYEPLIIIDSFEALSKDARAQAEKRPPGDVSKAIEKHISRKVPTLNELKKAVKENRVCNQGNTHGDWRHFEPNKKHLLGYTVDDPGSAFQFLDGSVKCTLRSKMFEHKKGDNLIAQRKNLQPLSWYYIVDEKKPVLYVPPGEIGATAYTAAEFHYKDSGETVYGCTKSDYHEHFYKWKHHPELNGRWGCQLIQGKPSYEKLTLEFWMINKPFSKKGLLPYILTHSRKVEEEKAKKEGLKDIIWNPNVLHILQRWLPSVLKGVDKKTIDAKVAEYTHGGSEWHSPKKK